MHLQAVPRMDTFPTGLVVTKRVRVHPTSRAHASFRRADAACSHAFLPRTLFFFVARTRDPRRALSSSSSEEEEELRLHAVERSCLFTRASLRCASSTQRVEDERTRSNRGSAERNASKSSSERAQDRAPNERDSRIGFRRSNALLVDVATDRRSFDHVPKRKSSSSDRRETRASRASLRFSTSFASIHVAGTTRATFETKRRRFMSMFR